MAIGRVEDTDFLKKARQRFKLANDADNAQAQREQDDLRFYAGDQWPADIRLQRQGQQPINGMPAVPARPTLTINKVREPIRQVQNEIRDSDIGIELTPADDFGDLGVVPDDTEITLREGLLRRILRDSNAADACNWAGDRADIAGRGWVLITNRYLPGKTNDQEVAVTRIYNQNAVTGDPSRTEPDGSDSEYWFIGTWMLWERFKAEYPKVAGGKHNPLLDATDSEFMKMTEDYPEWCKSSSDSDGEKSVRIVDYWYTERESRTLVTLSDGTVFWEEELPETLPEGVEEVDRRTVVEKQIQFCKIGGGLLKLEETTVPGGEMPIVEFVGEELHPYDQERRIEGMVRNARDAQMGENYMISKFVETVGLAPIPALIVDPDAIDGYETWYAVGNTRALPFLPSRTYDDEGRPLKEPHRPQTDPNILPMAQGIALFDQFIKSTTAVPDPTLGNVDPSLKSGKAIRETVMNAKGSTSNFISNRMRSMRRVGEVVNGMLYPVYGQNPGRMVRIMTGEGTPEVMQIGEREGAAPVQMAQKAAKVAKLTEDARFNIAIKVTKNYDTRRQQEYSEVGQLIGAEPQLMTWFGDLYLGSSDMPNRKEMAERAKVMLAPQIQQLIAQKEQGQAPIPPQVQAQLAQAQETIQKLAAALQEAEPKRMEAQTKIAIAKGDAERDLEIERMRAGLELEKARMDNATKIHVAEISARTKGVQMAHEAEHEAVALAHASAHEATESALDRQHEREMATLQMAHAGALDAAQGDRDVAAQQFQAEEAARAGNTEESGYA